MNERPPLPPPPGFYFPPNGWLAQWDGHCWCDSSGFPLPDHDQDACNTAYLAGKMRPA